jgi:hypothetical protein
MAGQNHIRDPVGLAFAALLLSCLTSVATAQIGPVDTQGYLEYRYRNFSSDSEPATASHNVALQGAFATYFWRPWIANVDGTVTLHEITNDNRDNDGENSTITGRVRLGLLSKSSFPFSAFYESRDNRLQSDTLSIDGTSQTFGFLQNFTSERTGRYTLEYRNTRVGEVFDEDGRAPRDFVNGSWYLRAQKSLGNNELTLNSQLTEIDRSMLSQKTDLLRHTLRHRYRGGPRFSLENTVFLSDEQLDFSETSQQRKFQQLSTISTWRPESNNKLLVTGRGLLQNIGSMSLGSEQQTKSASAAVTATYRLTDNFLLTGSLGGMLMDAENDDQQTTVYQRIRAGYQSGGIPWHSNVYRWGAFVGVGNRTGDQLTTTESQIQDIDSSLFHSLARPFAFDGGGQFEVRVTQRLSTIHDSIGRERNSMQHSLAGTYNSHSENTSRYIRLSATDRRNHGDERQEFQLANLQLSISRRADRYRSLSGNITLQYTRSGSGDLDVVTSDSDRFSYSANVTYRHANLFGKSNLNLTSELRMRSLEYQTSDALDPNFDVSEEQLSSLWRNQLDYRIGALVIRFDGDIREVDGDLSTLISLYVRRHFGAL